MSAPATSASGAIPHRSPIPAGVSPGIPDDEYLEFTIKKLNGYSMSEETHVTEENRLQAQGLLEYIDSAPSDEARERVSDFFVNSYIAEVERGMNS